MFHVDVKQLLVSFIKAHIGNVVDNEVLRLGVCIGEDTKGLPEVVEMRRDLRALIVSGSIVLSLLYGMIWLGFPELLLEPQAIVSMDGLIRWLACIYVYAG